VAADIIVAMGQVEGEKSGPMTFLLTGGDGKNIKE
jgi:hypothetical protein